MDLRLFHIFRNTPLGRETLLQSTYFCKRIGAVPVVYIPRHTKFLMYFENDVVQVDLDGSYLTAPDSAQEHARGILAMGDLPLELYRPRHFTASTLPDIGTDFDFMCCPRSISDLSSKIGLGYIGPRVRRIVRAARFPVLITSPCYKEWRRVMVFFGGSSNAVQALRLGMRIRRATGFPLDIFTQVGKGARGDYEKVVAEENLAAAVAEEVDNWLFLEKGAFEENLYQVPHDALVVLGAFGHGLIRDIVFGSMMERIQSVVPNNLLIVGPNYTAAG